MLVKAVSAVHPDAEKDRRGSHKKGDIIVVKPDGHTWGAGEGPPTFVVVKCPAVDVATAEAKLEPWRWNIAFEVLNSNLALDGHRVKMTNANKSVGGLAVPEPARVQEFLDLWGATLFSSDAESVTFDIGIYTAATSVGFWAVALDDFQFSEVSYNQGTGVHRITVEYSAHPRYIDDPDAFTVDALQRIARVGGALITQGPGSATFEVTRADVRERFRAFVTERLGTWRRHRWYFTEAQVDTVLVAGGTITVTAPQLANAVQDRLAT